MTFNLLSLVAGICYITLGIFVISYKFLVVPLEANIAYLLGGLLIVYGVFRLIRVINKFRKRNEE
ncbi:C4-dicarboxylate ABC transporter [Elizabethkingia meningoseptica]|uniref:C4-dicarboxylate ABC transporter n=1 Tax=Elizabethkingia meningoseptica TaxID=238 RepID=A0A1V3U440_ELIME|nr:C4-dicarboxylate ABC transporter [Elizabethkingia meningoseptica]AQX11537.1 C4-dicarboxylate ABC transporter [Elizabethkingia meningoseptica]AQX46116.1 C4-dicarboxylate ABC transporter [Elizabethkingia meningoseptica]KUY15408.1 C4-dicarboxylate ABC transporter [Elizabethkingia meningoseptica]MVW92807.1 C4-dicarboxylate ABC transporter [Elizabethkingia meningoseptica]